jgi:hypothetical protein
MTRRWYQMNYFFDVLMRERCSTFQFQQFLMSFQCREDMRLSRQQLHISRSLCLSLRNHKTCIIWIILMMVLLQKRQTPSTRQMRLHDTFLILWYTLLRHCSILNPSILDFILRSTILLHVACVPLCVVLLPGELTMILIFKMKVSVRSLLLIVTASSNIVIAREMTAIYQLCITFDGCITNQAKGISCTLILVSNMPLPIIKKL